MKRTFLFFLLAVTSLSYAQIPTEKSLLWKISGKDIEQPSYLYGTFHLLCPADFDMNDAIKKAFNQTKQLYLEIDMSDSTMTSKVLETIKMKGDHKLQDFITPRQYDSAAAVFQSKVKMPLAFFVTYKPFAVSAFLYPSMMGCTPVSFENEFMAMAKKNAMPVKGFETIEFQMNIFDEIPYDAQAKMLVKNLLEYDKSKADFDKMVAGYKTKDLGLLQDAVKEDEDFDKYESLLLTKRNKNWIPQITKAVKVNPIFIAVGAGHLGGETGVISLLRKEGYTVTPVMY